MGNYLTSTQVEDELARIIRVYHDGEGAVDTDKIDRDIQMAEGEIDASIRARYATPATDAEAVLYLRGIALSLVRLRAYSRLAESDTPFAVMSEAKAARTALHRLSSGAQQLPGQDQDTTNTPAAKFGHVGPAPAMTRAQLERW
jgi:phage gp36-like protein